MNFNKVKESFFVLSLLILAAGCAPPKEGAKIGAGKKVYHNITARNNAYFNANLKLKTIQKNIATAYKDDYNEILTLYPDRDPETAQTYGSELDIVIKKASTSIRLHKPSKWTDNSYLLVGKSYLLKGDLETAMETFQFITTNFKSKDKEEQKSKKKKKKSSKKKKKKKKKKRGKPQTAAQIKKEKKEAAAEEAEKKQEEREKEEEKETKVTLADYLKQLPTRPEALIMLVDVYTEMKKFHEAETVLTLIDADEDFPARLRKKLELARANFFLQKNNLENAIEPLTTLIDLTRRKKNKVRYYYVLAQIFERLGNSSQALENYKLVLKCRPEYEMEFNAKMSIARISGNDNSISQSEVIAILNKLLKDDKNIDFFDQIYYALAELSLKHGNKEEAIDYLKKSAQSSTTNTDQKGLSFLKLGQIYFNDEEYRMAHAYYDSTLTFLSPTHKNYRDAEERNEVLAEVVEKMNIIEEQDSLQTLAAMPEEERNKVIEDLKKKKEEEEKTKAQDNSASQPVTKEEIKQEQNNGKSSGSSWYFYNQAARSNGYNDFVKKWGKRKLEDNWRRSDRSLSDQELASNETAEELNAADRDSSALDDEVQLPGMLPSSAEDIGKSNQTIIKAYYELANIYKSRLKNDNKAIATFEELVSRYPENEFLPECLYNLYLLYQHKGNSQKSDYYKQQLISKFPDSRYSKYIQNPNFMEASKMREMQLNDYYRNTYNLYLNNQIDSALSNIHKADSLFDDNTLKPKFALLEAYAIGKSTDLPSYIAALEKVISDYPDDEVQTKAQEIIDYLGTVQNPTYQIELNISHYKYDPEAIHFFLIAYTDSAIKSAELMNAIASYNDINHSLEDLKINTLSLKDGHNLLLVKSFKNKKTAVNYYNAIKASEETFASFPVDDLQFCVISDVNFNKVITHREIESYFRFFDQKY